MPRTLAEMVVAEKEFDPIGFMLHTSATNRAPVAQLDRVSASGAEGHGFESRRAYHFPLGVTL